MISATGLKCIEIANDFFAGKITKEEMAARVNAITDPQIPLPLTKGGDTNGDAN